MSALPIHILNHFAKYIESQLGIIYMEANYFQLEHRLRDITSLLGFKDLEEFYEKSQNGIDGQMKALLLDLATNNETSFFRDPTIYKALSVHILPDLCSAGFKGELSIWSAASSSGQEAYSIAIEVAEARKNMSLPPLRILVSDVSDTILKRAQSGVYSQLEVQRGLPAKYMVEYFDKDENDFWKVKSSLQSGMEFRKINLLSDWTTDIGPFDVVFLRNVLIYQSVENKKRVIEAVWKRLKPGGYLFLGAAESLFGISENFKQIATNGAIIYQKKSDGNQS